MRKTTAVIIGLLIVAIAIVAGNAFIQKKIWSDGVAKLDEWSVIEGNEYNGNIKDIVIGNESAKVTIIEYADFQCSACAISFPYIHEVVKEFGDDVLYIYRNYAIQYHNNATAAVTAAYSANNQGYFEKYATAAVTAAYSANNQGYFEKYAEIIFEKQNDWFYSEGEKRDKQFEEYFVAASEGEGDIEKYRADLKSVNIKNKIAVDRELANRVNLSATPLIFINKEPPY